MNVVIIGSGGYIGKYLSDSLSVDGVNVTGISSSCDNGIDKATGRLHDSFSIPSETDVIIYLAQSPYYRQLPEMAEHLYSVNVLSAIKVAELGRKAGIKRFIYTSTGNVYSPSLSPLSEDAPLCRENWYSLSKIHAEEALSLYSEYFDVTIARLFGVYGPNQPDKLVPNLLNAVASGSELFLDKNPEDENDKDGMAISLCYIDDIVNILKKIILEGGPNIINIAGEEVVSIRKIVESISSLLDKPANISIRDNCRQLNLIADASLITSIYDRPFTSFNDGIRLVVDAVKGEQTG